MMTARTTGSGEKVCRRWRQLTAAISANLNRSPLCTGNAVIGRNRDITLNNARLIDCRRIAKVCNGAKRTWSLATHRAPDIENDFEHPSLAAAPRHHGVGAGHSQEYAESLTARAAYR